MPNDGSAPEVRLSPRDQFKVTSFYGIVDKLHVEMRRRGQIYQEIAEKFSFLIPNANSPYTTEEYGLHSQKLIDYYPEDLNNDLQVEVPQLHSYITHKERLPRTHAQLYQLMNEDRLEAAFPNVQTALRIFLCMVISNCTAERSFSKLKILKNEKRTTMRQERLDALSILYIQSDILRTLDTKRRKHLNL